MWNNPWRIQEGFVIGGGLICAGLILELTVGKVEWNALSWPANLILLVGFLLLVALLFFLQPKSYFCRFLASYHAATLLVVGPEGDVGGHHMVRLPRLHALPPHPRTSWPCGALYAPHRLRPAPDVLVGH